MSRLRLPRPPDNIGNPELSAYLEDLYYVVNNLPNFSLESFSGGPESNYTADPGTLLIDVGSSVTKAWIKQIGSSNTGWIALDNE